MTEVRLYSQGQVLALHSMRRVIGRLKTGIWLEREAVKPAAARRVDRME
jgi:hypothetical protein